MINQMRDHQMKILQAYVDRVGQKVVAQSGLAGRYHFIVLDMPSANAHALANYVFVTRGLLSLNLAFFTHLPAPVGESGGGMANSIVGTLILTTLGSLFAVPIGILSGIYMSEYAGSRFAFEAVR